MDGHPHDSWNPAHPYDGQNSFGGLPPRNDFASPPPPPPPPPSNQVFRASTRPRKIAEQREDRNDREERYGRIAALTRELSNAVRDEMSRRKQQWDVEGSHQEEEYWEGRKQEVYKGLEQLSDEIRRAFRDRRKEAVLDLWSREQEVKRHVAESHDGIQGPSNPSGGRF